MPSDFDELCPWSSCDDRATPRVFCLPAASGPCGRAPDRRTQPLSGSGPSPAPPPPKIDQQVQNERPKFLVRVSVDKEYRIYGEGEAVKLNVRCEEDAFLYVLYQQADGKIFQIFPNSGQPENRIKGKQDIHVPDLDDAFRWIVGPPFGKEVVKVIASKKPVDVLSLPGLKEEHFNPVSSDQVQGAGQQLANEPASLWSEHDLAIQTVRKGVPTTPPEVHKRFGVFFGVSKHQFNDQLVAALGPDEKIDLNLPQNDAKDTEEVFKKVGRLADARVFVNEQATREQIRQSITEWLPSVSRAGDTVFFFFSGHGAQMDDDDNDEKDGKDELLVPYDAVNGSIWVAFIRLRKEGKLPPECVELMNRLGPSVSDVFDRAYTEAGGDGNKEEANRQGARKASAFLFRSSAVGDDEMGHWLQKLDGRHVVVITDACRSGGLVPTGGPTKKGLKRLGQVETGGFDFLKSSMSRLKDLDQRSLTVLTAASEQQDSAEYSKSRNGLFTEMLLKILTLSTDPVDTQQAWEFSRQQISDFFTRRNEYRVAHNLPPDTVFEPQLFSTEPTPIALKPAQ